MNAAVDRVLGRLKGVKKSGRGWRALCPAHDDVNPSLMISDGREDNVVLYCHAGCSTSAVVAAMGLTLSDLWAARPAAPSQPARRRIATYGYTDAAGVTLYRKVRYEPKGFRYEHPDGRGGWDSGDGGASHVPYNLPAVARQAQRGRIVVVVEGEKDADALNALGFVATTNCDGANHWTASHAQYLTGAQLIVFPDNDDEGRRHAEKVARLHAATGSALPIKVVPVPGVGPKGDMSDWLAQQGAIGRTALRAAVIKLVEEAPVWVAESLAAIEDSPAELPPAKETPRTSRLIMRTGAEIEPEEIHWLWPGYVPLGKLSILEGDPGLGKSLLTIQLAAAVSTGKSETLPGWVTRDPADVVFVTYEDGLGDTVLPRLIAADANLSRIHFVEGVRAPDPDGPSDLFTLPMNEPDLRAAIIEHHAVFVVIDPLVASLSNQIDSYKDQHVRRAMAPLAKLAEDTGAAIDGVRHLTKAGGRSAMSSGGGSVGIGAAARMVLAVGRSEEEPSRRILAVVKCNIGVMSPSLEYSVESDADGRAVVVWHGVSSVTAEDLAAARSNAGEGGAPGKLAEAKALLPEWLSAGPMSKPDIVKQGRLHGLSEGTLERAARALKLTMRRTGAGLEHRSMWSLPYGASTRFIGVDADDEGSRDEASKTVPVNSVSGAAYRANDSAANGTRVTRPPGRPDEASAPTGSAASATPNQPGRAPARYAAQPMRPSETSAF